MRFGNRPHEPPNNFLQSFNVGYDQDLPVSLSFERVRQTRGWKVGSKRWKKAWKSCMDAEYDRLIGSRMTNLAQWQELCSKVGIEDTPSSITQCKKVLRNVHVNIVDLLDCWNDNSIPRRFKNQNALAAYTRDNDRYFGRNTAKQDKVLKVLLREIL